MEEENPSKSTSGLSIEDPKIQTLSHQSSALTTQTAPAASSLPQAPDREEGIRQAPVTELLNSLRNQREQTCTLKPFLSLLKGPRVSSSHAEIFLSDPCIHKTRGGSRSAAEQIIHLDWHKSSISLPIPRGQMNLQNQRP